jgi:hypothetical protein
VHEDRGADGHVAAGPRGCCSGCRGRRGGWSRPSGSAAGLSSPRVHQMVAVTDLDELDAAVPSPRGVRLSRWYDGDQPPQTQRIRINTDRARSATSRYSPKIVSQPAEGTPDLAQRNRVYLVTAVLRTRCRLRAYLGRPRATACPPPPRPGPPSTASPRTADQRSSLPIAGFRRSPAEPAPGPKGPAVRCPDAPFRP